ncbi:MAG: carbamoyl-phosphate synthase large subunit [bacterium]
MVTKKNPDIDTVMVVGSGPIVIGQAAEFDKALRELGYKVILVNSNPATIQTDKEIADKIYIEPLDPEIVADLVREEQPDGFLGTLGGQTGLNLTADLDEMGVFDEVGVEVMGTSVETIHLAEDREKFLDLMEEIDEPVSESYAVNSVEEAYEAVEKTGYPVVVRPAYTLGGTGGGVADTEEEFEEIVKSGLERSQVNQVLIDESLLGWVEYEYEVMRDKNDNCMIVCNMENVDPMGMHTGESIVTAPAQILSDEEHQLLRSKALKIIRALDIQGGCNIQFCVNPETRDYSVIEVNPRVSRSSALASKVTGYPIAKISAQIATGMTLDEIPNDIIKDVPAGFEPTIDYCVVKMPRWPFDRFPQVDKELTTQMKSTGEAMAIGRRFEAALQKAIRSLDTGHDGITANGRDHETDHDILQERLENPTDERIYAVYDAFKAGMTLDEIHEYCQIPPFYLSKIENIYEYEQKLAGRSLEDLSEDELDRAKQLGFSYNQITNILETDADPMELRTDHDLKPKYKMVDTCAGEFEAETPYYYSSYENRGSDNILDHDPSAPTDNKKVMVLGGGPIRIGQGIEFDYCCVHASIALREENVESIMVNNNPETVSTDYDTSDRLYFEPLTVESVMELVDREDPDGVIVQFGGQTPLNIAAELEKQGVNVLGTSSESIDRAENRQHFTKALDRLGIPQADFGTGYSVEEAKEIAHDIGYPVLVRPSYVLGGKTMEIVYDDEELEQFMDRAVKVNQEHPILIDKFLEGSTEVDVDAVSDGEDVFIGGIMEHIEEAGIHSGDSACVLPPQTIDDEILETIKDHTRKLADELDVVGVLNIQFAVHEGTVYLLEANPRASRTIPFVSKSVDVPLAKIATKVMLGRSLEELGYSGEGKAEHVSVKESVFPFEKLPGVDPVLGPEMKSTGEVMGIDHDYGRAYSKAQLAAGNRLPMDGTIFISVSDRKKEEILPIARGFGEMGFNLMATVGTKEFLNDNNVRADLVNKVSEGSPHVVDLMLDREIDLIINIPTKGKRPHTDGFSIRRRAIDLEVPYITTATAAEAALEAIKSVQRQRSKSFDRGTSIIAAAGT